MVIDGHVHVGQSLYGLGVTPEQLLQVMDEVGINKSVIVPVKPRDYDLSKANSYVAQAVRDYPDKFIGVARIDPWLGNDAIEELERACLYQKLKGIALHPWEENFQINNPIVFPIMDFAERNKLPVVIEGGYPHVSHPLQIADLARRYPKVTVVMTNGGELDLSGFTRGDAHTAMKLCPNLIMGTSGLCSHERLVDTVNQLGPNRVIFESHLPMMEPSLEILRITRASISEEAKEAALSGNALRIYS
ncbi:MAG: amidohydrolase family protein [Firmicutes bacterium]|nr:amidohydrolase family protein [Bacillota bacterium]